MAQGGGAGLAVELSPLVLILVLLGGVTFRSRRGHDGAADAEQEQRR